MNTPIPPSLEAANNEVNRFMVQLLQKCRETVAQADVDAKPAEVSKPIEDAKANNAESESKGQVDFVQAKNVVAVPKKQAHISQFLSALPVEMLDQFDRKQSSIISALKQELNTIFVNVLKRPDKVIQKKKNSLDDLALVDDDALMIRLVLDNFATKVNNDFKVPIAITCLRFEKVLGFEIDLMLSPLSPYSIGNALDKSLVVMDLDVNKKKALLMALLKAVIVEYPNLLQLVNDVFIRRRILPRLTDADGKARIEKYLRKMKAIENGEEIEEETGSSRDIGEGGSAFARDFFKDIAIKQDSHHHVITNPNGVLIPQTQLLNNIGSMQKVLVTADDQSGYLQPVQTESSFAELLAENTDIPEYALTAENSKTIGIISMLFDTLKNEAGISAPIKALLLQLTVPLLKAAVQDDEFFSDKSNPAQILFNSIAEASSSWTAEKSVNNDFLYQKMSDIVQRVTDNFENDYSTFETAVEDFEDFVDIEKQKTERIEERIVATETAKARIQAARKLAEKCIYDVFGDFILDEELKRFIDKSWEQALFYIANNNFDDRGAAEWKLVESIESTLAKILGLIRVPCTIDELFAEIKHLFVLTGRSEHEVIAELEAIRPELNALIEDAEDEDEDLSNVKNTFQPAKGVSAVIGKNFEEDKEKDYIRDDNADEGDIFSFAEGDLISTPGDKKAEADDVEAYMKTFRASKEAEMQELLSKIGIGSWLEDKTTDPATKVKLAAHIKYTDTYVFVNRKGVKAASYDGSTFASRLQEKLMVVVDNSQLYDRSMENIIGSLRQENS